MNETVSLDPGGVIVKEDAVFFCDFEERDPVVVAVLTDADNLHDAAHQILRIGAQAIQATTGSLDTALVEKSFGAMADRFDQKVGDAVGQIAQTTESMLGENGGVLPVTLEAHRRKLEELLDATFDPDSKKSVLAVFETLIAEAHDKHVKAVRELVSVDSADSPLRKMKLEIIRDMKDGLRDVRLEVQGLSEKVAVKAAEEAVMEITTAKGFEYEDVVHDWVARAAAGHGDLAEMVGTSAGSAGTKKGDEVVTVNQEDTHGLAGRFVIEAKARHLGMRKTLEELEGSLVNRDALAAIAVFSSQDQAPTPVPFHYSDNKAIVVFDSASGDDGAIQLAYMWARWVVRRQLATTSNDEVDVARITTLIDDVRRALERQTTVKRNHTQAKKFIDQAATEVGVLVDESNEAIGALASELESGNAGG